MSTTVNSGLFALQNCIAHHLKSLESRDHRMECHLPLVLSHESYLEYRTQAFPSMVKQMPAVIKTKVTPCHH